MQAGRQAGVPGVGQEGIHGAVHAFVQAYVRQVIKAGRQEVRQSSRDWCPAWWWSCLLWWRW